MPKSRDKELWPFNERASLIARVFEKCVVGTTLPALKRFITAHGGNVSNTLRALRSGRRLKPSRQRNKKPRLFLWDVNDGEGRIQVSNVRMVE